MGFDMQAFMLYGLTQNEAIEYIRRVADAGDSLSPKALKMLADLFDPNVENRGRPKENPPLKILEAIGLIRVFASHGFLKEMKQGQSWQDIILDTFKISKKTLERLLYENDDHRWLWRHIYVINAIRLWLMGEIQNIKVLKSIPPEVVEGAVIQLFTQREIDEKQMLRIARLIETQNNIQLDPVARMRPE